MCLTPTEKSLHSARLHEWRRRKKSWGESRTIGKQRFHNCCFKTLKFRKSLRHVNLIILKCKYITEINIFLNFLTSNFP